MRDFQRSKVYKWEKEEFGWDTEELSLSDCQLLVDRVLDDVICTDGRGRRRGAAFVATGRIALPKYARKRWYVLHECAHFLASDRHGPIFVQKYCDLLAKYYQKDVQSLYNSLKDAGVKYE